MFLEPTSCIDITYERSEYTLLYFKKPIESKPVWPEDGDHFSLAMLDMMDTSEDFYSTNLVDTNKEIMDTETTTTNSDTSTTTTTTTGTGTITTSTSTTTNSDNEEIKPQQLKTNRIVVFKDKSWIRIHQLFNISTMFILRPVRIHTKTFFIT